MQTRPVRKVTLELDDGSIETYELPEGAGFFRNRYTYPAGKRDVQGISKWAAAIETFEIFWTRDIVETDKGIEVVVHV